MPRRTYSFGDEPQRPRRSYSLDPNAASATPPHGHGPWGNVILWPCPGTYSATLRAKLYSFRLFDRTWQDGAKAKRVFFPWRDQWLAAEQASRALGSATLEQAPRIFRELPLAPTTYYNPVHAQPGLLPIPELRAARRDQDTLSTYGNLALAYVAHAWASADGGMVALRFDEHTIAAYSMAAPTCQQFFYAKARLAPGAVALELSMGYQWWIPPGAGITGWPGEKWRGEAAAVTFSAFTLPLSYRILCGNDGAKRFGFVPEGGESTDLMILLAARRGFLQAARMEDLPFSAVVSTSGHPLFPWLDGALGTARQGLYNLMSGALDDARQRMESALA